MNNYSTKSKPNDSNPTCCRVWLQPASPLATTSPDRQLQQASASIRSISELVAAACSIHSCQSIVSSTPARNCARLHKYVRRVVPDSARLLKASSLSAMSVRCPGAGPPGKIKNLRLCLCTRALGTDDATCGSTR
jgi:hypothetical protein